MHDKGVILNETIDGLHTCCSRLFVPRACFPGKRYLHKPKQHSEFHVWMGRPRAGSCRQPPKDRKSALFCLSCTSDTSPLMETEISLEHTTRTSAVDYS